jgi:hypothetical protein
MSVTDLVKVVVSLSAAPSVTRPGFGVPMALVYHSHFTDRVRVYSGSAALDGMVADGFLTTEPAYRLVAAMVSQDKVPTQIAIGRRANAFTQVLQVLFASTSSNDPPYALTLVGSDGVSHTHTMASTGVPATDCAAFAALLTESNIGIVSHSSATLTITQTAGLLTDLQEWTPATMQVTNATTDPGIAADFAAVKAANGDAWYGVCLDSNSKAEILALQQVVEATGVGGKIAFYDNSDHANVDGSSTTDVFSRLEILGYKKCYCQHNGRKLLSYAGAAMAGLILADNPGAYQLSWRSLAGVPADDDVTLPETQQLILNTASTATPGTGGKNANWYKRVGGTNLTMPGVTPTGQWFDFIIFQDWLQANLQIDIFAWRAGLKKAPYTTPSLEAVGHLVKVRMVIGASAPYEGIVLDSIVVNVPKIEDVSQTDKNARNLSGFSASGTLTGGINTVSDVEVTLSA